MYILFLFNTLNFKFNHTTYHYFTTGSVLEIINESNDCTSLKQIRKKNQQTDQNLLSIIKQNDKFSGTIDLYTFIRYNLTGE